MEKIALLDGWQFWRNGDGVGEPQTVRIPHDAMIGEERSAKAPSGSGGAYFHGGIYRYERELVVEPAWDGCELLLEFEGIYRNARVLFDGVEVASHAYGYTGFDAVLTASAKAGDRHVVTVIADNSEQPNSRWYSGSGIYRPVWLHVLPAAHIQPGGIAVQTVSLEPATVRVTTAAVGADDILVEILDGDAVVAEGNGADVTLVVPDARLWTADEPNLYVARVTVIGGGEPAHQDRVRFGIRTVELSEDGLLVNGASVKLRGGCVHHDNGILGSADLPEASYRKVALLKRWGFNALRSAHNPMSRSMLDACDELGMYVMDEFADMWYAGKNTYDYSRDFEACWEDDLAAIVRKDRSHPSVVLYSIGNENMEPGSEQGVETAKRLVDRFHALDASRPVTAGVNLMIILAASSGSNVFEGLNQQDEKPEEKEPEKEPEPDEAPKPTGSLLFNMAITKLGPAMDMISLLPQVGKGTEPYLSTLDLCGYNYATKRYAGDLRKYPERIIFGSETMPYDIARNWRMVEASPRLLGDFMWTAIDYLGEVSLAGWSDDPTPVMKPYPWVCADTGALDLIGNPNGEAAMAAVVWDAPAAGDAPLIYVRPCDLPEPFKAPWRGTNSVPSWTWLGCEDVKTTVEVYTKAPIVKLWLNGRHIWTKRTHDCHADFTVRYKPGKLVAAACTSDGTELSRAVLATAEGPLELSLKREGEGAIKAGEVVFVDVVLGRGGVPEGNADREVSVAVEGGELVAFGSAAQKSKRSFIEGTYPTRYGLALAAVRVTEPGVCIVRATAEAGLQAELAL